MFTTCYHRVMSAIRRRRRNSGVSVVGFWFPASIDFRHKKTPLAEMPFYPNFSLELVTRMLLRRVRASNEFEHGNKSDHI